MTATLLAVDDSKTMRKVIEITFAGENYRMVMAENPTDAMAKLRSEKPSIALVDALLGGSSGYDLCQQIKAEAPQVGVIVLSSKQHPYDRVKGNAVGADDFLDKPYDTQALIDKVAALTQKLASAPVAKPAAAPAAPAARPAAAPVAAAPVATAPVAQAAAPAAAAQTAAQAQAQAQSQAGKPHTTTMSFANPGQARAAMAPAAAPAAAPAPTRPAPVTAPAAASQQPVRPAASPTAAAAAAVQPAARPAPAVASAVPVQPAPPASAAAMAATAPGITAVIDASMEAKLSALGLTKDQIAGVVALSREVVEQVVWEVVPQLAETMIREEIRRLSAE